MPRRQNQEGNRRADDGLREVPAGLVPGRRALGADRAAEDAARGARGRHQQLDLDPFACMRAANRRATREPGRGRRGHRRAQRRRSDWRGHSCGGAGRAVTYPPEQRQLAGASSGSPSFVSATSSR